MRIWSYVDDEQNLVEHATGKVLRAARPEEIVASFETAPRDGEGRILAYVQRRQPRRRPARIRQSWA